jgi:hypothetical protein
MEKGRVFVIPISLPQLRWGVLTAGCQLLPLAVFAAEKPFETLSCFLGEHNKQYGIHKTLS